MLWIIIGIFITALLVFFDDIDRSSTAVFGLLMTAVIGFFVNAGVASTYDDGFHTVETKSVKDVALTVVNNDRFDNDVQIEVTFTDSTKRQYATSNSQLVIKSGPASVERIEPNDPSKWLSLFPSFHKAQNIISTPTAPSFKE